MIKGLKQITGKNFDCEFVQQWTQFFKKCKWWTFAFIEIDREIIHGATWTFTFIILGLGFRLSWISTEYNEEIEKLVSDAMETTEKDNPEIHAENH